MRVLGIDPGTAIMGYGVVESVGQRLRPVAWGALRTQAKEPMPQRLVQLYTGLQELISAYNPTAVAMEELFFNKNVRTALTVGQARGVALLAAAQAHLPLAEYTPLEVKLTLTGEGRAEKAQVAFMVGVLLGVRELPKLDDITDALAIAICHLQHQQRSACLDRAFTGFARR